MPELLRAVGEQLQRVRLRRKWRPTDVQHAGGPTYKTVQAIEKGEAGHIESLDKCAQALQLSIVDVVDSVLRARETPLSPDAAHLVKKFNEMTIDGRMALLAMANALPPASAPGAAGRTRAASIAACPSGSKAS